MRNTFISELLQHARKNDNIVLIVGDLGYSVVEPFAEEFPDRYINAGVAEQNMTGIAAGMASEGYHVFTYSIANFPTFRCAEQIRNDIDYHNLPVTVVSVGGGLAYGNLGYSHHAVQDFALIRSLPNMLIAAPGDPVEVSACLEYLVDNPQPSYLRLNKAGEPILNNVKLKIMVGQPIRIRGSEKVAINILVTTGALLELAVKAWENNQDINRDWIICSLPLWGEQARTVCLDFFSKYKKIVTLEEHILAGGFGSWLAEMGLGNKIIAIDNSILGEVGTQKDLLDRAAINEITLTKLLL